MEVYWVFRVKTVYNVLGMKSGFLMAKERVGEKVFCIKNTLFILKGLSLFKNILGGIVLYFILIFQLLTVLMGHTLLTVLGIHVIGQRVNQIQKTLRACPIIVEAVMLYFTIILGKMW